MGKIGTAKFTGVSGTSYVFDVYTADTKFNDVDALYVFTKRTVDQNGSGSHKLLYIGETDELGRRINSHEKWECVNSNGCNCICIHRETDDRKRLAKETDLRKANPDTPCNDQ